MKLTISFKNIEHTPALDAQIKSKSEHFWKYFEGAVEVQWVCWINNGQHYSEIKFWGPNCHYFATAHSPNLYKSFDLVVEKLEKQIIKKKEKYKDKLHHRDSDAIKNYFVKEAIQDEEEAYYEHYLEDAS
jgi:putative sigma-54 modulation protein